jgi:hypothetical protein
MMKGRELSRLQGILKLKFSYGRCRKRETPITQEVMHECGQDMGMAIRSRK